MATQNKMLKGTVLKMAVNFSYPSDPSVTLENIEWYTEWYTTGRKVKITKEEHILEDGVYYAVVDTAKTGEGTLKMRLWAEIPDPDVEGGFRVEYGEYTTKETIY
jgi:hypothetical protein